VVKRKKSPPRKGPRRSPKAVAEHADRILEDARRREQEYARVGMTTVTISRSELILGLSGKTAHSPFLTQIGYSNAVRGTTFLIDFGVMQPDGWMVYSESNFGICYCWSDAGGLMDPSGTLAQADPTVGVIQVSIGNLNSSPTVYYLSSTHPIPATFRLGPADLNWFMYMPDAFGPAVLLKRGTIRVVVT
jgi:hypothetical protein